MDTLLMVIKLIEDGKIKIECQIILLEIRFKDKIKYCKWSVPLNCIIFFYNIFRLEQKK